jgi:hypothetical protein
MDIETCSRSGRDAPCDTPAMSESASTSDATTATVNVILHVWPGRFGLASIEPTCLAAVLYLQMAIPGKFTLEESTTPDYSPNGTQVCSRYPPRADETSTGQLPYLTHDLVTISSLSGIMTYVSGLPGASKLNGRPSAKEKAQCTAWKAHAASTLGDLVVGLNSLRRRTQLQPPSRHIRSIRRLISGGSFDRRLQR